MFNFFKKKEEKACGGDHTFFEHRDENNIIIGQKCSICGDFNSLEEMGLTPENIEFIKTKM